MGPRSGSSWFPTGDGTVGGLWVSVSLCWGGTTLHRRGFLAFFWLSFKKLGTAVESVGTGTILHGLGFWFYRDELRDLGHTT